MRKHKWTAEDEQYIRTRDAEGATTGQIAAEMGMTNKQVYQHRSAMNRGLRERERPVSSFRKWLDENMVWRNEPIPGRG